jgi:ferredoxin-type protein NapH
VTRKNFRKIVQLSSLGLIFLIPLMNKTGITIVTGTLYSLAIGPVWITDPVIGLQVFLSTMKPDVKLFLSLLTPIAFALVLGRVFCSWVCPQNTLSELFDTIAGWTGIRRLFAPKPSPVPRYVLLGSVLLATLILKFPVVSLLSAPGIISVQSANLVYGTGIGIELGLIAMIAMIELVVLRRAWCNYFCPVGGFLGLLRVRWTMKIDFSESKDRACGGCLACADACGLGLDPMGKRVYPLCHNCGDCVAACESMKGSANPLRFTF